jgi:hypothetical protein
MPEATDRLIDIVAPWTDQGDTFAGLLGGVGRPGN